METNDKINSIEIGSAPIILNEEYRLMGYNAA